MTALGEPVPAAHDLRRVVEPQLAAVIRQLPLKGAGDRLLVDREDENLVVGEQLALDRLTEPEPVELGTEPALVVH